MNAKMKASLWAAAMGAALCAAVFARWHWTRAAGWPLAPAGTPAELAPAVANRPPPLPVDFPRPALPPMGASANAASVIAPAASIATKETVSDSNEYAEKIAGTPTFKAFAKNANIEAEKQRTVSRLVALYYMDEASLTATVSDREKLGRMRQQLRQHMDTRVRASIPQSSWDAFEQSGLLPAGPT